MSPPVGSAELEAALLARARTLASEFQAAARLLSSQITATANERLRRLEENEVSAARAEADRLYRQRVQGAAIQLRGDLDRKRWRLVQAIMEQLPNALDRVVANETTYLGLLSRYLADAAATIECDHLVAAFNARDRARVAGHWDQFCHQAGVTKQVTLDDTVITCTGGIRVSSSDDRIRVDHTFEGRMERFSGLLYQTIIEKLFGSALDNEGASGGSGY